jgi:hypothetical protein
MGEYGRAIALHVLVEPRGEYGRALALHVLVEPRLWGAAEMMVVNYDKNFSKNVTAASFQQRALSLHRSRPAAVMHNARPLTRDNCLFRPAL